MFGLRTMPRSTFLPPLYRAMMSVTGKRGMRTLSRINRSMYPGGQTIRLTAGSEFYVPPDPHFFGYVVGHDAHIARLIAERVEEGDVCVDVGANIGYFSVMLAARCGRSGQVLAYEPEPGNFAVLSENARIARARGLTITPTCAAVSDRSGLLELVRGPESTLHEVRPFESGAEPSETVRCVSLPDDLSTRGFEGLIKLLKVDVEGHEAAVLSACLPLFAAGRVHAAVVEVTPGESAAEIAAIFRRCEASVRCWVENDWVEVAVDEIPWRTDVLATF